MVSSNVICSDCGTEFQVPFIPRGDRPLYCSECFRKYKSQDFVDEKPGLQERDHEYSNNRNIRLGGNFKSKSKTKNFLKKQESFYSGGSEKFYNTLKEKLFEILGGKTCYNCGFNDERALGFGHVSDEKIFDDIRRGGSASSWGKYISNPKLAREELKILCLNCNELKKHQTIPKEKNISFKKKSNRFPR